MNIKAYQIGSWCYNDPNPEFIEVKPFMEFCSNYTFVVGGVSKLTLPAEFWDQFKPRKQGQP